MSAPPYQKLFWGSYHKHTAHLSHAREHGAYLLLIGALWNNEGRLPADDDVLAGYAKLTTKEWLALKPRLMPLFKIVRGKLTQPRVTDDLAKYRDTSGKRKEAGKAGGLASRGKDTGNREAIATRLPTKPEPEPEPKEEEDANASFVVAASPSPTPSLFEVEVVKPEPKGKARTYPEAFEAAWKAYPHTKGRSSKPLALARWSKLPKAEQAIMAEAARRFAPHVPTVCGGKGAPDMAVWIGDGKHLNWIEDDAPAGPARVWPGPADLRAAVIRATTEDFAVGYLDPCEWRGDPAAVIAPNTFTASKLRAEAGHVFDKHGVGIVATRTKAGEAVAA